MIIASCQINLRTNNVATVKSESFEQTVTFFLEKTTLLLLLALSFS